jgi:hypothetical protein
MSDSNNASGGVGFTGLLTVLFIGLKLGKVIDWSWWWVLSPMWISAAFAAVVIAVVLLVMAVRDR